MNPISYLQAGHRVITKRASGVCDIGERSVGYEGYELDGRPGWSFMFASGRDDGFSPADVATFLKMTGEVCQDVARYHFKHVGRLYKDFHQGRFAPVFHVKPITTGHRR